MKRITKYILILALSVASVSCEGYLDSVPDDAMTIDEVFQNKTYAERYLANVYKYLRCEIKYSDSGMFTALSDELDITYADSYASDINLGAMTPASGYLNNWSTMYKGIRSATYFMNRINEVPTVQMTNKLKAQYKSEARFMRAICYFYIFRQYGPFVIIGDDVLAPDATLDEMALPRSTVGESVDYIVNELNEIIESKTLPEVRPDKTMDYGRITEAACRALKGRVLLYAASDFYNTDINTPYKEFKDNNKKSLFDYTNVGKAERWQRAATANKDVIDMGAFSLYTEKNAMNNIDPYLSFKNLFGVDWNVETIFGRPAGSFWETEMHSPRTVNAWSGWAPTQALVDAFFTKNGLPIDKDPTYKETGFSTSNSSESYTYNLRTVPYTESNTFNMYCNREPRFYASLSFDNSRWCAPAKDGTYIRTRYYKGGNSGVYTGRNYPKSGYGIRKHNNPSADVGNNKIPEHVEMLFRLAETYLNYVEALNEINYSANLTEILTYLNLIRERAGIPIYGYGAEDVPVPADQAAMRKAIYQERRVELALEGHRYFDAIRWMTTDGAGSPITFAEHDFNGPMYGMAVNEVEANFFKRTVFETRVWKKKNNLFPIPVSEIYKDKNLVQNPFWTVSAE